LKSAEIASYVSWLYLVSYLKVVHHLTERDTNIHI